MTQPAHIALPRATQSWWASTPPEQPKDPETSTRSRYQRLLSDPAELDARLARGERHACRRADRTLARTVVAMGL